jgi:hypothetical protein
MGRENQLRHGFICHTVHSRRNCCYGSHVYYVRKLGLSCKSGGRTWKNGRITAGPDKSTSTSWRSTLAYKSLLATTGKPDLMEASSIGVWSAVEPVIKPPHFGGYEPVNLPDPAPPPHQSGLLTGQHICLVGDLLRLAKKCLKVYP